MEKKGQANVWMIIAIVLFIIIISGAGFYFKANLKNKPLFKSAEAEPNFIIPNDQNKDQTTVIYEIYNPTLLDLSGQVEFLFDDDCLETYPDYQDVLVKSKDNQAFNKIFRSQERDLPDKCYQSQSVFLRLTDTNNSLLYDTKEIKILVTQS